MPDEPKKNQPDDIQSILSDLDAILSGDMPKLGVPAPAAAPPPAPAAPPSPPPAAAPASGGFKIELPPRDGIAPPKPAPAPATPPPPKSAPVADTRPGIELSMAAPAPVKAPEPVKPPEPVVPAPAPVAQAPEPAKPASPPPPPPAPAPAAPAAPVVAAKPGDPAAPPPLAAIPADAPKEQMRRVAYAHTATCVEAEATLNAFLAHAARSISKKPLFLRSVLSLEVGAASDPRTVHEKAKAAQAVALLVVVDGWPDPKINDLSDACAASGMLFRAVAPGDVQKKSTAVDIIVDMMLLPGEA